MESYTQRRAVYDGKPHTGYTGSACADEGRISESGLEFIYKDSAGTILASPPVNAGTYKLIVRIPDTNMYYKGSTELTFTVNKANRGSSVEVVANGVKRSAQTPERNTDTIWSLMRRIPDLRERIRYRNFWRS